MSIPKKKLADVKRQVFKARAAEEKAEDHVPTPARREQLFSARMAARQVKTSARQTRPKKVIEFTPQADNRMRFNLEVDSLVRINRDAICIQASTDAAAPWVAVKKGSIGVLISRYIERRHEGVRSVEFEMGHVMLPQGLLKVDLALMRGADEPEEG